MRILLATEGDSDQVVAEHLLRHFHAEVLIDPKRFPAQGYPVVRRLIVDTVRAAYYGDYDLLAVHFDLDDTLPPPFQTVADSLRWKEIQSAIETTQRGLKPFHRSAPLQSVLMAPLQSTDAWQAWGQQGGDGRDYERQSRHALKRQLFGDPPRGLVTKSQAFAAALIAQMASNHLWPQSLREFMESLQAAWPTR